ncbi:MAG: MarR family transcriptional regulator [Spirochaetaceae bacterium]|nr:MarR family transcriptional regulator [Spirochaetaceae bacterium]
MTDYFEDLLNAIRDLRQIMKDITYKLYRDAELTLPQIGVVAVLSEQGPCKVSSISKYLGLANSTVSGIIDRLVKKGIVERTRLETDRRSVVISLTEGSDQYYVKYKEKRDIFILEKLKDLNPSEAREMTDILLRLNGYLKDSRESH